MQAYLAQLFLIQTYFPYIEFKLHIKQHRYHGSTTWSLSKHLDYDLSLSVDRDLSAALETRSEEGETKGLAKGEAKRKAQRQHLIAVRLKKEGVSL